MYVLFGVLLTIAIILVVAATKPNTVHYERSTVINTRPERILAQIDDFREWGAWSPWDKLEPDTKRTYSGASSRVGAKYAWEGKKKAGVGNMEITQVTPDSVKLDLNFIKPWEAQCITLFKTTPEGQHTRLIWTMDGPNTYMGKVFGLFMNMDSMIGKDFETGLAGIKQEAEQQAAIDITRKP